ncbi:MAG: hypothetical protein CMG23_01025 [Candidatus Marinimicrobia bacterium]|nr:hypothetical protein [Candidatus Neomarinimicrobiota bacterium]|tara:strand:+ start:4792 stop:5988 length:1197 start_codon:yes stop_codon:yes gene_type:complete
MGLEHTLSLLDFLNNPQEGIKTIHIAGTNGKGSTGATIYSILREYGYKVGLYTSPHLIKFNERIRINGRFISDEEIMSFMRYVQPSINEIKSTFFEVTTAMAFNHFNEKNVDIAIIETGLGGRLDSTNVVNPVLTVMTPISFDHIDILGDTIEKIAAEKAGIVKDRVPLITAKQLEEVFNILKRKVNGKKATIDTPSDPIDIKLGLNGTGFKLGGRIFLTSLIGNHQAENASLAISAVKKFNPQISYEVIAKGLKNVSWPGRLQLVSNRTYYDVAHNEGSIQRVLENLNTIYPNSDFYGLFCLKGDKELRSIAKYIKSQFKMLFVTTSQDGLLLDSIELSKKLKKLDIANCPLDNINLCMRKINSIRKPNDVTLIFGTHYIAKEIFSEFEISFDSGLI